MAAASDGGCCTNSRRRGFAVDVYNVRAHGLCRSAQPHTIDPRRRPRRGRAIVAFDTARGLCEQPRRSAAARNPVGSRRPRPGVAGGAATQLGFVSRSILYRRCGRGLDRSLAPRTSSRAPRRAMTAARRGRLGGAARPHEPSTVEQALFGCSGRGLHEPLPKNEGPRDRGGGRRRKLSYRRSAPPPRPSRPAARRGWRRRRRPSAARSSGRPGPRRSARAVAWPPRRPGS
jgi:hypothetical protein